MLNQLSALRWRPAKEWINDWLDCTTFPTNLSVLDQNLYRSGLPEGYLTLLYGHPGSGKTQLAMHCVIQAARHYNKPVVVLDTHKTWKTRRLYQMAEALGVEDPDAILAKILIEVVSDFKTQLLSIRWLLESVHVSFVCIDTILNGKVENKVRFRHHIEDIAFLARQQQIPVLLVSQVYDQPEKTNQRLIPRQGSMLSPWTPIWIELQNIQPIRQGRVFIYQQSHGHFKLEIGAQLSVTPWEQE
ncbi:MAG: ATPase domain-containing protein [Candidatus Hermodarchaeota archaeon]